MQKLINQLKDICETHLLDEKILIVPSNSVGRQILQALTKDGQGFMNLKAVTLKELAKNLCENRFYEAKLEYIDSVVSLQFLINKIKELLLNNKLNYFNKIEVNSTLCTSLLNSLLEIRMAGLESSALDENSFVSDSKGQDIKLMLSCYEAMLKENNYIDSAKQYKTSVEILDSNLSGSREKLYYVVPDLELTYLEMSFLEKLTKGHYTKLHLSNNLEVGKEFNLLKAYGESNEVNQVFQSIKKMGVALDTIAVFYTDTNTYTQLFYDGSCQYGIPITFGDGINIKNSTSGRLFSNLISWIKQGFLASSLYDIFLSGDFKVVSDESISIGYLVNQLKDMGIGWGRTRYLLCLDNAIKLCEDKVHTCVENYKDHYEKKHIKLQALRKLIDSILEAIPEQTEEGLIDFKKLIIGLGKLIDEYSNIKSEIDGEGKKSILDILKLSTVNCEPLVNQKDAIEFLEDIISGLRVKVANPKNGFLHICSYRSGTYIHRSSNFLVGVDSGKFPGSGLEDPIVLDTERTKLSPYLSLKCDEINRNNEYMNRLISSLSGKVFISYSSFDTTSNRAQYPSFMMLKVYRFLEKDNSLDYSSLSSSFTNEASFAITSPEEALDEAQWWLSRAALNNGKLKMDSLVAYYKDLGKGITARANRETDKFTAFDGKLSALSGDFNPKINSNMSMSTSQLEMIGKCPYEYFLKYILNIKVPEEYEYDASVWLDPAQRGSLLHSVFENFYKRLKDNHERPSLVKHADLINSIGEEFIDIYKMEIIPPSEIVFQQERSEILQCCRVFLISEEEENSKAAPCYFELSFGREDDNDEIGVIDKVEISLKNNSKIYIKGIIDRVDKEAEGLYRIIDYKTGSSYNYDNADVFKEGRQLQHALYSVALEQILRDKAICISPRVIEAGYIFPTLKGKGGRYMRNQENRDEFYEILDMLLVHLEKGSFHMTNNLADCRYCDYKDICEREALERYIGDKIADIDESINDKGGEIDG
ncbi:MAG TPA: PD-(D/E)XK nuclease family protein [Clostridiaceae bacterium]